MGPVVMYIYIAIKIYLRVVENILSLNMERFLIQSNTAAKPSSVEE
jgi:hypothetical protein